MVDNLRAARYTLEPVGEVLQPFFTITGQVITINNEQVQVFEYETRAAARDAVAEVSPDGSSVGTSIVSWVATPHFYRKRKLIVLYFGDNIDVFNALETMLGSQFVGGYTSGFGVINGISTKK